MDQAKMAEIVGRYIYLEVDGTEYRVYYEEAGAGVPVVLQHTAGTDTRQWRYLLEDKELTSRFRFIAYDLPFHGKSVPPVTEEWWTHRYLLNQAFLLHFVMTFIHALGLERPVYMGSSMGGHLAPDLALHYPGEFSAVIALEGALATHDTELFADHYYHPRVTDDLKAALMYGMMAPTSPEACRRETAWIYSQGAPPVHKGDVDGYYAGEHDLTAETAKSIDTTRTQVHVLGGEYDWSAYPQRCQALADAIDGATYTLMEGLGHFPMSEDPMKFKEYLAPILEAIAAQEQGAVET